ncbi:MAG: hypothetical protein WD232_02805 [Acidimicrobiales bacterium]
MSAYEVVAHNTATRSENAMHHDDVARRYGFRGGLVPGVDVYAYLTHPSAERWGLAWLERGRMEARFLKPAYDGDTVRVVAADDGEDGLALEVLDPAGDVCATGRASLPDEPVTPPDPSAWPLADPPEREERPPAGPDSLAGGTVLGLAPHRFAADAAVGYLGDVRESLALYAGGRRPPRLAAARRQRRPVPVGPARPVDPRRFRGPAPRARPRRRRGLLPCARHEGVGAQGPPLCRARRPPARRGATGGAGRPHRHPHAPPRLTAGCRRHRSTGRRSSTRWVSSR